MRKVEDEWGLYLVLHDGNEPADILSGPVNPDHAVQERTDAESILETEVAIEAMTHDSAREQADAQSRSRSRLGTGETHLGP